MKEEKPTYQELESQLAEAREVIDTIKNGQADAILAKNQVMLLRLKKTEEALRQSEEEKNSILNNTVEAIAYYDLQNKLQWANRAYLEITGKTMSEVKGVKCYEFRCCEGFCPECPVCLAAGSGMPQEAEVNSNKFSGWSRDSRKTWLVSAIPFKNKNGLTIGVIEVSHDISKQKQVEEQLKRSRDELEKRVEERTAQLNQRAQQLSKLTTELMQTEQRERLRLARIVHDNLQQLIAAVKFNVSAVNSSIEDGQMQSLTDNALQLLDQAIDASRSLAVDLSPPVLHQPGLINSLKWLCRWMEKNQGLAVELEAGREADTDQEVVKRGLFESVRELLNNVIKHSGVLQAKVRVERLEQQIMVRVSDQGRGFDPAKLEAGNGEETETCFGLFSMRERINGLGGKLEINSKPGQGAEFTITLPLAWEPTAEEQQGPASDVPATDRKLEETETKERRNSTDIRVMLVDDHTVMRQGLASILKRENDIEIVGEADTGEQALELALRIQPDVILMDYKMPGMNGVDTTRTILARQPNIRIIGLSMHEESSLAEAMQEAGAIGMISKTSPASELLTAIRQTF